MLHQAPPRENYDLLPVFAGTLLFATAMAYLSTRRRKRRME